VNAVGEKISSYCIFKTDPTEKSIDNDLDDEFRFAKSESAFSSTQHTLDWLKMFNVQTFNNSSTFQQLG
jgi:hypothetical protein